MDTKKISIRAATLKSKEVLQENFASCKQQLHETLGHGAKKLLDSLIKSKRHFGLEKKVFPKKAKKLSYFSTSKSSCSFKKNIFVKHMNFIS